MVQVSRFVKNTAFIVAVTAVSLSLSYFALAVWSEPVSDSPTCNSGQPGCDAPVNTSADSQTKGGPLGVTALFDAIEPRYSVDPNSNISGNSAILKGKVGIGAAFDLSDPEQKLDIDGALRLNPSTEPPVATSGTMYYDSGLNKFRCRDNIGWNDCEKGGNLWIASGNAIYNSNIGNVGIGTSAPTGKFTVAQSVNAPGTITTNGTAIVTGIGTTFLNTFTAGDKITINGIKYTILDVDLDNLLEVTANVPAFTGSYAVEASRSRGFFVQANGTVGVGTSNPRGALDVSGIMYLGGIDGTAQNDYIPENFPAQIGLDNSDAAFFLPTAYGVSATGDGYSDLRLYIEDNLEDRFSVWGYSCGTISTCKDLSKSIMGHYFQANGNAYHFGNIGIGIEPTPTSPKLTVNGNVKIGSAAAGVQANKALCWTTNNIIGYCSTQPNASGVCTCNPIN